MTSCLVLHPLSNWWPSVAAMLRVVLLLSLNGKVSAMGIAAPVGATDEFFAI